MSIAMKALSAYCNHSMEDRKLLNAMQSMAFSTSNMLCPQPQEDKSHRSELGMHTMSAAAFIHLR